MNMSLDDPPTVAEVEKATAALSSGKASGSDAIPAEIYNHIVSHQDQCVI